MGDLLLNEAGGGGIFSLNTSTGAASLLASPGFINDNGFTEDRELGGYWAVDWDSNLYRFDNAFNRATVANLGDPYAAVAWVGDVREPHALLLVGLGTMGVALSRRRSN